MTRTPPLQRASGVTMLELLVVIAIIGVLTALVIPRFGDGVSTTELKGAARQLASGLRLARSEAMASRQERFVTLDLEGRRFIVGASTTPHALPRDVEMKLFTAQKDLVDDKVGAIRFYPDGGSNGGRITLAAGERKFEVDVDWLTGRVAILQ
ncbi:MAG TPA: GspH/FimT family pseudopilin [Casimicrobiaceae bacterium]|nr:GspH/FimT family pseudopilin [Casimicrobiaceae bacterium]